MGGKSSRTKGHNYERELARELLDRLPHLSPKRGLQSRGGDEVADVEMGYLHIEAKRGAKPNPRAALAQAIRDATAQGRGKVPVAVVRDDRKEAFVVMTLEDFIGLVHQATT